MAGLDGGRVAARGFQYQYLRTLEALLASCDRPEVYGCRIEGPVDSTAAAAIDVVDFDLVGEDDSCLLAAQVKSAAPGRRVSAPDAFVILAEMVAKHDAVTYELITAGTPDAKCLALAQAITRPGQTEAGLREAIDELLTKAPRARSRLHSLTKAQLERMGRCRMVFDPREEDAIRRDLHTGLRERRSQHRAGLGERSAGLVVGHLLAEILRRAAEPQESYWSISDFAQEVLVEDDILVRALGRRDWGSVYGPIPPVPDVIRPTLLEEVAETFRSADPQSRSVNTCVLTGLSGIGKSSTAAAFVAEYADQYDLIFWVEASTDDSLTSSFRRLWGHLHGKADESLITGNVAYLQEQVHELLSALSGKWLIIFDDGFAKIIDPWIPRLGRGDVLITSIDAAGWVRVGSRVEVDRMTTSQSLELFSRRMCLTDDEATQHADQLIALADALEGWPLAIELACGYLRSCDIPIERLGDYRSTLLSRALDDRLSVPTGYPRTLISTVDLSLERLADLLAAQRDLSQQVIEVLGYLCNLAPQRIPVHLVMVSAFIAPDAQLIGNRYAFLDEADFPVREIIRALLQVSFVRYDDPLPALSDEFSGSDDTISMNAVLQDILRQYFEKISGNREALSHCAFHADRWLTTAVEAGESDRAWLLAQHASILVEHARRREMKDNHTAILIGNLAAFKQAQGQIREAIRLLWLELAWLDEIDDPNDLLITQTRISLAHAYWLEGMEEAVDQVAMLLPPLVPCLERMSQEGSAQPAAAVLATKSAVIVEDLLRRQPEDVRLVTLHRTLIDLAGRMPEPPAVTEIFEARQVESLFEAGKASEAERMARGLMGTYANSSSPAYVEMHRLLIEALTHQARWREAEAEFEKFLDRIGPRSLYHFSVKQFVHNVGFTCAAAWVYFGFDEAASMLNKIVRKIDLESLAKEKQIHERTRFTLLRMVDAAVRQDSRDFRSLMDDLHTNPLQEERDEETPWEDLLAGLLERMKKIYSSSTHQSRQTYGEELLRSLGPGWQNHPDIFREFKRASVEIGLGLNNHSPFTVFEMASKSKVFGSEEYAPLPLIFMQPSRMLIVQHENGESMELQIHRICGAGFRLANSKAFTVPDLLDWELHRKGSVLQMRDSVGEIWARGRIRPSHEWSESALRNHRVLVIYGFGFDLTNPVGLRKEFASPEDLLDRFHAGAECGLLAAAYVPWKSRV